MEAAVPGFKPEEVEVTYPDALLNISAGSKQESEIPIGSGKSDKQLVGAGNQQK